MADTAFEQPTRPIGTGRRRGRIATAAWMAVLVGIVTAAIAGTGAG